MNKKLLSGLIINTIIMQSVIAHPFRQVVRHLSSKVNWKKMDVENLAREIEKRGAQVDSFSHISTKTLLPVTSQEINAYKAIRASLESKGRIPWSEISDNNLLALKRFISTSKNLISSADLYNYDCEMALRGYAYKPWKSRIIKPALIAGLSLIGLATYYNLK